MEKKELKERFFDRFFYAEDGSGDWDRWRNQDPNVVLEFILEELSKAREEGRREQAELDRALYGVSFEHIKNADFEKILLEYVDKAREEGYQKGWEDGSKGRVFEKIEVETEVTFKDLRDVIEGKEDAGEFLSKLTTK